MPPVPPDPPHRSAHPELGDADPPDRGVEPVAGPDRRTGRPPVQRSGGQPRPRRRAPLAVAAGINTCWAALVSFLPVATVLGLAQLTEDSATFAGAIRIGLAGWLLGHGVPLGTSAGPIGLAPLALGALAAWRVARAGVHTSRAIGAQRRGSPRQALAVAGTVGLWYGVLGALAAVAVDVTGLTVSLPRAGLTFAVFGALSALLGAARNTDALGVLAERTPAALRDGVRTGLVAALLVLGAGAAAAGLAVATGGGEASDMLGAYRTGVAGQAGITLLSVAYAPNAAIWAACYLLGPGFAVGTDTAISTTEVTVGALPAVPLIAGLPSGPVGGSGALLLAVPVLAGMAAGWLGMRRTLRAAARDRTQIGWLRLIAAAAIAGPVAGVLLGLAALVSGGPLGGGRLMEMGPVPWLVAAIATLVLAAGAMIGAAAARVFSVHPH
ncbi:cell division protein PerM [Micromonospora sp. NPDC003197]